MNDMADLEADSNVKEDQYPSALAASAHGCWIINYFWKFHFDK
jgi:hypothetical protein